jgi:putative spermidine/putrescine transport system permease protein
MRRLLGSLFRLSRRLPGQYPLISILVGAMILYLLAPTLIVLAVSFDPTTTVTFPPDGLSLRWYLALPEHSQFLDAFFRSVYAATLCTVIGIPVGVMTGIGLMRFDIRLEKYFQLYFLLPFTVPLVVSGVILLIIFGETGVIGQLWTVGLALAIINIPFMIWSVTSRVNALDPELEAAAENLGAEEIQRFVYVTFPAILPGVVTGSLIMFVLGLNEFIVSLLITTNDIVTLPVLLYTQIRSSISPLIAAVASIYIVVAFLTVIVADRLVGLDEFLKS